MFRLDGFSEKDVGDGCSVICDSDFSEGCGIEEGVFDHHLFFQR